MTLDPYAPYDYAWKTPAWTVQNPDYNTEVNGYIEPGLPADVSMVRVFGNFLEWDTGRTVEGVVRFRVNQNLMHVPTGRMVMMGERKVRFRNSGFSVLLPATDDPELTPNGFKYECRLTVRGVTQHFEFSLPAANPEVNITSLIPPEQVP